MTEHAKQWFIGYTAGLNGDNFFARTKTEMRGWEAGTARLYELLFPITLEKFHDET